MYRRLHTDLGPRDHADFNLMHRGALRHHSGMTTPYNEDAGV